MKILLSRMTSILLTGIILSTVLKATAASHPMDGLNSDEINTAMKVLGDSGQLGAGSLLISLDLESPNKEAVLRWREKPTAENLPSRSARAVIRRDGKTVVAVVAL